MSDNNKICENLPVVDDSQQAEGFIDKISKVVPQAWKNRLRRAAVQIVAGTEKGAEAYGSARERLDTIEGRTVVSNALAEAVAKQVANDPEQIERARARFLGSMLQKQENIESVITGASTLLSHLPPPEGERDNKGEPETNTSGQHRGTDENSAQPLHMDWASAFSSMAENANSEELRERLSKILAGELVSPGTFSRATVRLIFELDRNDIENFQKVMPYVIDDTIVRLKVSEEILNTNLMLDLNGAGLVGDTSGLLSKTWPRGDGKLPIGVSGREWLLAIYMVDGHDFQLPITPLTRAGQAVLDLLGRHDERPILKKIANEAPEGTFSKIVLGRHLAGGKVVPPIEQIFPPASYVTAPPMRGI